MEQSKETLPKNTPPIVSSQEWENARQQLLQTPPYNWWNSHDNYNAQAAPDQKWIDILTDPQEAARKRAAEEKS